MRSGTYTIYKSKGAAQFTLVPPTFNEAGYIKREGAVMLEVAPGNGDKNNPVWDWSKKVIFALGIPDICRLVDQGSDGKLTHDNGGVIKRFHLQAAVDEKYAGTFMLKMQEDKLDLITVPFTNGEYQVLMQLLKAALPLMLNWTSSVKASRDAVQNQKSE